MTRIIVRTGERIEIRDLWRMVLKFVFAEWTCDYGTRQKIENYILNWYEFIEKYEIAKANNFGVTESDANPVGMKGNYIDETKYQIQKMAQLLRDNERGDLECRKETYRRHGIDYRKTLLYGFAFPEMYKDYEGAQRALEQNKKERPEDYA